MYEVKIYSVDGVGADDENMLTIHCWRLGGMKIEVERSGEVEIEILYM